MADKVQIRTITVRNLSAKSAQEIAEEKVKNARIRQLASLRIYHQRKIEGIDRDLAELLKDEVSDVDY